MTLRISNLHISLDEPEAVLPRRIADILGLQSQEIGSWRILRQSLDLRNKDFLQKVYSIAVEVPDEANQILEARRRAPAAIRIDIHTEQGFVTPVPGQRPLPHRPIVVGSGPGGLACACFLAEQGYQPLVLERGRPVRDRIHDVAAFDQGGEHNPESNYLFGEGGAGTFSDGKLTYRGSGPDVEWVLNLFAQCKGKPSILYESRPHLGSNRLPAVVKALRRRIESLGGEVRFSCRLEDLDLVDGRIRGLMTSSGYFPAEAVILAIGHSARDTYEMLVRRGVSLVQKPFQLGLRIEQPQEAVNRVTYGSARLEQTLGQASYELVAKGPNNLFTFCMCAGGYIMPSVSEPGAFCTNGMSLSKHDSPYANSGLVVTLPTTAFGGEDVLAGVRLQQHYERIAFALGRGEYACPVQRATDFLADRSTRDVPTTSYPRKSIAASMAELAPPLVIASLKNGLPQFDHLWRGRFLRQANLVGPETRGSAPVRMIRDDQTRESIGLQGLYPVGEGAGYAGGIISAAVDGLRSAKSLISIFAKPG